MVKMMKPFKYNPNHHSGRFNNKITFQHYTQTENDMGDTINEWTVHSERWAMIKTVQGKEFVQAASVQGERSVRFVIRYAKGLTNDMRIKYDGRMFEIIAPPINDDELNKTLTIMTREVV
jgi:SPP1 family predicted phage head-tail adaptor